MVALYKHPSSGQNINAQKQTFKNQTNLRDFFNKRNQEQTFPYVFALVSSLYLKKKKKKDVKSLT